MSKLGFASELSRAAVVLGAEIELIVESVEAHRATSKDVDYAIFLTRRLQNDLEDFRKILDT